MLDWGLFVLWQEWSDMLKPSVSFDPTLWFCCQTLFFEHAGTNAEGAANNVARGRRQHPR